MKLKQSVEDYKKVTATSPLSVLVRVLFSFSTEELTECHQFIEKKQPKRQGFEKRASEKVRFEESENCYS